MEEGEGKMSYKDKLLLAKHMLDEFPFHFLFAILMLSLLPTLNESTTLAFFTIISCRYSDDGTGIN